MDTVYMTVGQIVLGAGALVGGAVIGWLVWLYSVGFVRSVQLILWLDRNARKEPAVGMTMWEKVRGVFLKWHEMAVFRPGRDSILINHKNSEVKVFRG